MNTTDAERDWQDVEMDDEARLRINEILHDVKRDALMRWAELTELLRQNRPPASVWRNVWDQCFARWNERERGPRPMWIPSDQQRQSANIKRWADDEGVPVEQFHAWTSSDRARFWEHAARRLGIRFEAPASQVLDLADGVENARWFPDARLNIVESCFHADPGAPAIVSQRPGEPQQTTTYAELRRDANRVSNSLARAGLKPGDPVGVVMPMTRWSVAIYLGAIQAGCPIVSIADSFAAPEIETRLRIAGARLVVTYDHQVRGGRKLDLFDRVAHAGDTPAVVIPWDTSKVAVQVRGPDIEWQDFLVDDDQFDPVVMDADETINILFSSGTTGDPKAIPWNQLTPLKCAVDGYCHQDIRPGHVCAWPTNLGWMMGPWLIFASLINRATIGLYEDAPMGPGFGEFVQNARVNMLGVVPTIVKAWRSSGCMEAFDWSGIHTFSSTGESSQRDDMFYLSSLAGMRPVIEYCGGTEIGGGYVSSFVTLPNVPAAFNTPAVGLDFVLVDSDGQLADEGEVFIVPPSIGLSNRLLNRDHHKTYYEGTPRLEGYPTLRRHGDHFRRLPSALPGQFVYVAGGRVDDTMNLGGIKISSAELERVMNRVEGIRETVAVAMARDGGPAELVVFVVPDREPPLWDAEEVQREINQRLKTELNPLFRASHVEIVDSLPRTASGKVMRRKLRDELLRQRG